MDHAANRPAVPAHRPYRIVVGAIIAGASLLGSMGAAAQDAAPATPDPARVAVACDALFGGVAATPVGTEPTAAASLDEIPFELLAIDTLITHHESVIALTAVAEAGATESELGQFAGETRGEYQLGLDQLREWRDAWYPGSPAIPAEFRTALLDRGLAAAGTAAGGGFAPPSDPLLRAHTLCDASVAGSAPFDAAAIDLLGGEFQEGVAVALLVSQEGQQADLATFGAATSDTATGDIGTLATWRDAWFGAAVPVVTPELPDHEH